MTIVGLTWVLRHEREWKIVIIMRCIRCDGKRNGLRSRKRFVDLLFSPRKYFMVGVLVVVRIIMMRLKINVS